MGNQIIHAVKTVFRQPRYQRWFVLGALGFFSFLYVVPVLTTPGDTLVFHATVLPTHILLLMIILSLGNGLLLAMQLYIHDERKKVALHERVAQSVTLLGILASAFLATIACAACYSTVIAFLGLGVTGFIVTYQGVIGCIALLLTGVALFYTARRVEHACQACQIR